MARKKFARDTPLTELTYVDPKDGAKRIQDRAKVMNPVTEQEEEAVVVIFRRFNSDEGYTVVALFPEIPSDYRPGPCDSYMQVGGHSAANYHLLVNGRTGVAPTRIARRGEQDVEDLIAILQRNYGYRLIVRERWDSRRNPQMPPPPMPSFDQGGPWDPSYYSGPSAVAVVPGA